MKNKLTPIMAIAAIIAIMVVMPEEIEAAHVDCKLVHLWEKEKQQGIDPYRRLGRPAANMDERNQCLTNWELPKP